MVSWTSYILYTTHPESEAAHYWSIIVASRACIRVPMALKIHVICTLCSIIVSCLVYRGVHLEKKTRIVFERVVHPDVSVFCCCAHVHLCAQCTCMTQKQSRKRKRSALCNCTRGLMHRVVISKAHKKHARPFCVRMLWNGFIETGRERVRTWLLDHWRWRGIRTFRASTTHGLVMILLFFLHGISSSFNCTWIRKMCVSW